MKLNGQRLSGATALPLRIQGTWHKQEQQEATRRQGGEPNAHNTGTASTPERRTDSSADRNARAGVTFELATRPTCSGHAWCEPYYHGVRRFQVFREIALIVIGSSRTLRTSPGRRTV